MDDREYQRERYNMKFFVVFGLIFSSHNIAMAKASFYLSGEFYDYRETLEPPMKSEEVGQFPSFGFTYDGELGAGARSMGLRVLGEFTAEVETEYRGAELLSGAPVTDTDNHQFITLGSEIRINQGDSFGFIAGAHYRGWNRKLNYGTGYREYYQWIYLPIGFKYQWYDGLSLRSDIELTVRPMIWGDIDIIFSETVVGGDDTKLTLGNALGYRLDVPIYWAIGTFNDLIFKVFYEYSEIGESDTKYNSTPTGSGDLGYIKEPASKTHRYGIQLGFSL